MLFVLRLPTLRALNSSWCLATGIARTMSRALMVLSPVASIRLDSVSFCFFSPVLRAGKHHKQTTDHGNKIASIHGYSDAPDPLAPLFCRSTLASVGTASFRLRTRPEWPSLTVVPLPLPLIAAVVFGFMCIGTVSSIAYYEVFCFLRLT